MNRSDLIYQVGSKCRIFGLGRSNIALSKLLYECGCEILISDKRKSESEIISILEKNGIKNANVLPYNEKVRVDTVFRTPVIRPDASEIIAHTNLGATLSSEVELFFKLAKGNTYGITGSDGKTTTSTLCYELLKRTNGKDFVFLGGNIGVPLISFIPDLTEKTFSVCELSSFQLMTLSDAPQNSVITTLTENHLDHHASISEYYASKCKIFGKGCSKLVADRFVTREISDRIQGFKGQVISPSFDDPEAFLYFDGENVYLNGDKIFSAKEMRVKGIFNVKNMMSAIALCYPDISREAITETVAEFKGVEHRNEYICTKKGVSYYNSSIDSSPARTLATLSCHEGEDIILLLGGYDKKLSYSELAREAFNKVRVFILFGENSSLIETELKKFNAEIRKARDIFDAVWIATECSRCGSSVLLSPASASFDMFSDYEERGKVFKNIINSI